MFRIGAIGTDLKSIGLRRLRRTLRRPRSRIQLRLMLPAVASGDFLGADWAAGWDEAERGHASRCSCNVFCRGSHALAAHILHL